ncbi:MAG: helicase C-terminal domain-containing protein [Saccharofermentanales bacterium]
MVIDPEDKAILSLAARQLAETVRRGGGLAGSLYAGLSGPEGIRIHQDFFQTAEEEFPACELLTEIGLKGSFRAEDLPFDLIVSGRCDLLALCPPERARLIEVKGFRGNAASLPPQGDPAHWAQAWIYAWLLFDSGFLSDRGYAASSLDVELRYIPLDGGESLSLVRSMEREELAREFESLCRAYADLTLPLYQHRLLRNQANREASFPYEQLRDGQKAMMQEVIAAIRDKGLLFVQAPTGIGKTMATLYPSVKAQANGLTDYLFYLTPTRSQRAVAQDTLDDMESQSFRIRSLTLQAKEQMCLSPEHFCDMRTCPYAVHFYDNLPQAIKQTYTSRRLLPGYLRDLGRSFKICPFELSLSLLSTVDVIICDYNYIFNPRVRLQGFLEDQEGRYALLVDEAHNLARRSREMFSSVLARSQLIRLQETMAGHPEKGAQGRSKERICKALARLIEIFDRYRPLLESAGEKAAPELVSELTPLQPAFSPGFLATRTIPPLLMESLTAVTGLLTRYLADFPDFPGRQSLMIPYFDLLFALRVADRYYDERYITTWRPAGREDLNLTFLALDASRHLTAIYRDRSPVVFFSATLSPLPYYLALLDERSALEKPEVIRLPSPFPKERRLVICYEAHSVRYQDRAQTVDAIARLILDSVHLRKGHYLIFSPSFAYQRLLAASFKRQTDGQIDFVVQPGKMTESQKENFLAYFQKEDSKKPLVGLTVLGSLFNEGVDLVGEELTGVIVIGTGLPGLSPERDLLRQYYDAKSGQGYQYAYVWPGFNRVTQAAGRLIRGQDDFGIVLLIDDRYGRPDYTSLIPGEWQAVHTEDRDECLARIQEFWQQMD